MATVPRQRWLLTTSRHFPLTNFYPYAKSTSPRHLALCYSKHERLQTSAYSTRGHHERRTSGQKPTRSARRKSALPTRQKPTRSTFDGARTSREVISYKAQGVEESETTSIAYRKVTSRRNLPSLVRLITSQKTELAHVRKIPAPNAAHQGVNLSIKKRKLLGLESLPLRRRPIPLYPKLVKNFRQPRFRQRPKATDNKRPSNSQGDRGLIARLWNKARTALSSFLKLATQGSTKDQKLSSEHKGQSSQELGLHTTSEGITAPLEQVTEDRSQSPQSFRRQTRKEHRHPLSSRLLDRPMKFYFQVITTPSADTPGTAILLHFDNRRYIFGQISEGTQRACIERGINLLNVRHIFLTGQIGWQSIGGLFGLILTLADAHASRAQINPLLAKPTLHVAGGPNLQHALATARHFVFRKSLPLTVTEWDQDDQTFSEEPIWSDDNIQIWAMKLKENSNLQGSINDSPESTAGKRRSSHDRHIRQAVVDQMFNSDWSLDRLDEVSLSEVRLPTSIFVRNPNTHNLEPYTGPPPGSQDNVSDIKVLVRRPWPGSTIKDLPPAEKSTEAFAYIIKSHATRGKFLPAKAKLLGVPAGPLFSKLASGSSVQSSNGNWVHSDMVLDAPVPGAGVAIIDFTNGNFEDDFCNRPEWNSSRIMDGVEAFIWLLKAVPESMEKLNKFASRFPKVRHYYSSASACPNNITFESSALSSVRLASLAPDYFAVPLHQNQSIHHLRQGHHDWSMSQTLSPIQEHPIERGLMIQIRPKYALQRQDIPPVLDTAKAFKSVSSEVQDLLASTRSPRAYPHTNNEEMVTEPAIPGDDAEIVTLGTGSALPSKYRNVSATLLRVPGHGSYLFDCGEGTLGQLKRMYPADELRSILLDLKMIWISHLHADHHLGLVNVLKSYDSLRMRDSDRSLPDNRRLIVASDGDLFKMLDEYSSTRDLKLDNCLLLSCHNGRDSGRDTDDSTSMLFSEYISRKQSLPFHLASHKADSGGLKSILFCPVSHCRNALAVSLVFPNGFKVSYSGDCRPSKSFIKIGQDSTVLIHEATFEDDKVGDAMAKKHSTIGEALGVGAAMRAKRVVLTHFSQRYQKTPVMNDVRLSTVAFEDVSDAENTSGTQVDERVNAREQNVAQINDYQRANSSSSALLSPNEPPQSEGETVVQDSFASRKDGRIQITTPFFPDSTVLPDYGGLDGEQIKTCDVQESNSVDGMKVVVAFDLMRLKVRDFSRVQSLSEAISDLFKSNEEKSNQQNQSKLSNQGKDQKPPQPKSNEKRSSTEDQNDEQNAPEQENKRRKLNLKENAGYQDNHIRKEVETKRRADSDIMDLKAALHEHELQLREEADADMTRFLSGRMQFPVVIKASIYLNTIKCNRFQICKAASVFRYLQTSGMQSVELNKIVRSRTWKGGSLYKRLLAEVMQRDRLLRWFHEILLQMGMSSIQLKRVRLKKRSQPSLKPLFIELSHQLQSRLEAERISIQKTLEEDHNCNEEDRQLLQNLVHHVSETRFYGYQSLLYEVSGLASEAAPLRQKQLNAKHELQDLWLRLPTELSEKLQNVESFGSMVSTARNVLSLPRAPIAGQLRVLRLTGMSHRNGKNLVKALMTWVVLVLRLRTSLILDCKDAALPGRTSIKNPATKISSVQSLKERLRLASQILTDNSIQLHPHQKVVIALGRLRTQGLAILAQLCDDERAKGVPLSQSKVIALSDLSLALQALPQAQDRLSKYPVKQLSELSDVVLLEDPQSRSLFLRETQINLISRKSIMRLLPRPLVWHRRLDVGLDESLRALSEIYHNLAILTRDFAHSRGPPASWEDAVAEATKSASGISQGSLQQEIQDEVTSHEKPHAATETLSVGSSPTMPSDTENSDLLPAHLNEKSVYTVAPSNDEVDLEGPERNASLCLTESLKGKVAADTQGSVKSVNEWSFAVAEGNPTLSHGIRAPTDQTESSKNENDCALNAAQLVKSALIAEIARLQRELENGPLRAATPSLKHQEIVDTWCTKLKQVNFTLDTGMPLESAESLRALRRRVRGIQTAMKATETRIEKQRALPKYTGEIHQNEEDHASSVVWLEYKN